MRLFKTKTKEVARLAQAMVPLAGALQYPWWPRRADPRQGRRDGKLGLPPCSDPLPDTPTTFMLRQEFLDQVSAETLQYQHDTTAARRVLRVTGERLAMAREQLERREQMLDAVGVAPTPERLALRMPGEAALPAEVARSRRVREHAAAAAAVEQAREQVTALSATAAEAVETIASLHGQLRARADRLHAFSLRRFGAYTRALVRRHPDGAQILTGLALLGPEMPDDLRHPYMPLTPSPA